MKNLSKKLVEKIKDSEDSYYSMKINCAWIKQFWIENDEINSRCISIDRKSEDIETSIFNLNGKFLRTKNNLTNN